MQNVYKRISLTAAITVSVLLVGCGGGGGGGDDLGNTQARLTGVVADGYLVGAKVCLDMNANKVCDGDEPTATTEVGGAYSMSLPEGVDANDYPVLVEVGVETVDEDTGVSVGKPYKLSAPAGKADFVSPLTTMVQSTIETNPGMSADDAAVVVKSSLGTEADLFQDYVNAKQDTDNEDATEYARLHKVAQVTARVIADNMEEVEAAAITAGLDPDVVVKELVKIVVKEVLDELSVITTNVDSSDDANFDATTVAETVGTVTDDPEFDVESSVDEEEVTATIAAESMQAILDGGVNWLDSEPAREYTDNQGVVVVEPAEYEHGRIGLNEAGDRLTEVFSVYDAVAGDFIVEADPNTDILLGVDGWVVTADDAENWVPTFNDDGSVTLVQTDLAGRVLSQERVTGSSLDVSGQPIAAFLEGAFVSGMSADAVFPPGSTAYRWNFTQETVLYGLNVWEGNDSNNYCDGQGTLIDYNGNCNTVWGYSSSIMYSSPGDTSGNSYPGPATTLAELIYPADYDFSQNGNGNGNWIGFGELDGVSVGAQLVAGDTTDAGTVRFVRVFQDWSQPYELLATGTWEKVNVNGVDVILFGVPTSVRPYLWDEDMAPGEKILLAEHNGFVRRGEYVPSGSVEFEDEWNFNNIALEAILINFTAL